VDLFELRKRVIETGNNSTLIFILLAWSSLKFHVVLRDKKRKAKPHAAAPPSVPPPR
jgi:hypothetical protein